MPVTVRWIRRRVIEVGIRRRKSLRCAEPGLSGPTSRSRWRLSRWRSGRLCCDADRRQSHHKSEARETREGVEHRIFSLSLPPVGGAFCDIAASGLMVRCPPHNLGHPDSDAMFWLLTSPLPGLYQLCLGWPRGIVSLKQQRISRDFSQIAVGGDFNRHRCRPQ
jgi:hypothetical protein